MDHLPYGLFSTPGSKDRLPGVRYGSSVVDIGALAHGAQMTWAPLFDSGSLDLFLAEGPDLWATVRQWLQEELSDPAYPHHRRQNVHLISDVQLHLPFRVADYVDFYASEHHASNIGAMLRPGSPALTPNWKHLPIGYHGRSSTIVVSGTPIRRPQGQRKSPQEDAPSYGPTQKLDIEAELAFIVGGSTEPGEIVTVDQAADNIFGVALFNDWSARDIQAWEYVPLGPFLGKSFASSMAAWITPMEALKAARCTLPPQDPEPLPYLRGTRDSSFGLDIDMVIRLNGEVISTPPYASMYWCPAQMLAHLTANGAAISSGDVFASGTTSGPTPDTYGSLMELSWNGTRPGTRSDGSTLTFLQDGDEVTIDASARGQGHAPIRLAGVTGTVLSAGA
ncbi:MAG: fumarylacetoacetase [Ornithinimicrobium sp.]